MRSHTPTCPPVPASPPPRAPAARAPLAGLPKKQLHSSLPSPKAPAPGGLRSPGRDRKIIAFGLHNELCSMHRKNRGLKLLGERLNGRSPWEQQAPVFRGGPRRPR